LCMSNNLKNEKMNTKNTKNVGNQSINNEKMIWIEWSNKLIVKNQFKTLDELMESGFVQKHASNFGYEHLVKQTMNGWSKHEINNIFIVDANPVMNYGLDFKIWIHYTTDGINFMMELSIGSSSMTSAPMQRVMLNTKSPVGLDLNNIANNTPEIMAEWMNCITNNLIESIEFSSNVWFKKDEKYRNELREMCKSKSIIFA